MRAGIARSTKSAKEMRARASVPWRTTRQARVGIVFSKKDIHPEFFEEAKVFCNGEEVTSMGGTQNEYVVDIWSGNHPFYQGAGGAVVVDEGRVNRFQKRYANLGFLSNVETVSSKAKKEKEAEGK